MAKSIITSKQFYDSIAMDYDDRMISDESNARVRKEVADYFLSLPRSNRILDFGAGTGEDLKWQLEAGFKVIFYEPSERMADKANDKIKLHNNQVAFLTGSYATLSHLSDYLGGEPIGAIFSNFAALNSIQHLERIFNAFHNLLKPKGDLVFVVYEVKNFKNSVVNFLKSIFGDRNPKELEIFDQSKKSKTKIFVHSKNQIIHTATGFEIVKSKRFRSSGHRLYHFRKRN